MAETLQATDQKSPPDKKTSEQVVVIVQQAIDATSESLSKLDALRRVPPELLRKPIGV